MPQQFFSICYTLCAQVDALTIILPNGTVLLSSTTEIMNVLSTTIFYLYMNINNSQALCGTKQ